MRVKKNKEKFNTIILIVIFIIILSILFKFVENMYYYLNTNLGVEESVSNTEIADWRFEVRIEF